MKQNDKQKWIELLRSNKFQQCFSKIQEPYTNQRCAVGVLFEAMQLNKKSFIEQSLITGLNFGEMVQVTKLNDVQHRSFAEIADWIDQNIAGDAA